ncbi:MAG: single-stranded-DNA-specific exonuclease RecJ, partial [Bacteroidales bacterium]
MNKIWIIKPSVSPTLIHSLCDELKVPVSIATLLVQRGVTNYEEARLFFSPTLNDLHNPYLMKDMDKAVKRISKAITQNEKILFLGDYDVDGTTSVALLMLFFRPLYKHVGFYIPDRYKEGYGVSKQGIDYAKEHGYTLIITLDCGIKANEKISYAVSQKIDVIICDHHNEGDVLPEAVAILNPKQSGCQYPFKELSGCGVGFKLLQAFCIKHSLSQEEYLYKYLDLVVVSIASDIVPITGENRTLAFWGLQTLVQNPSTGLKAIKITAGIDNHELTISDIVFKIGPRINAAGRISSGDMAVNLLISETLDEAYKLAVQVNDCNTERKGLDKATTLEALSIIDTDKNLQIRKSTVLYNKEWHKGVVGIVASRLTEYYYRPTIILTEKDGLLTGSARSVEGFDLYSAIDSCSHILENFGGHKYAAGVTLKKENFEKFSNHFENYVSSHATDEMLTPKITIDCYLNFDEITPKFFRLLKRFQPFGPDNMTPVFATQNVYDTGKSKIIGQNSEHLKLSLYQNGFEFDAIAFN